MNKAMLGIENLPTFKIMSLDSSSFINSNAIPFGRPLVFLYFDPNCEHCQSETTQILANSNKLRNIRLYMISNASPKEIKAFCIYYHLDTIDNIMIGSDYEFSFYKIFLPSKIPYMAIYDKNKKLLRIYSGEIDINTVVAFIKKESTKYSF